MLDWLFALSTLLLALSLAIERLIAIIKTIFPRLEDEAKEKTLEEDKPRRLIVQALAFLCAWLTCAFIADKGFDLIGTVTIIPERRLPVPFVALLSCSGSAFWSSMLGYIKATKNIKQQALAQRKKEMQKPVC